LRAIFARASRWASSILVFEFAFPSRFCSRRLACQSGAFHNALSS
jgi:hypothetical protein